MTDSVNKDLVRRYYEEIVSSGDVARIEEFIGSDYVEVYQNKRYELGLTGAREHVSVANEWASSRREKRSRSGA